MTRELRNAALDYADRGWHVFPLHPRRKAPLGRDSQGRLVVPNGKDDATTDLVTVLRWWTEYPQANIGLVARPSGLLILDVDPRHGGDDDLHELEHRLGPLPETVSAETGGGGWHYLFRHPGGDLRGKLGVPREGRDVRDYGIDVQDRKYVVAPPSIHPDTGRRYEWDLAPGDVPVADLPEIWVEALRPPVGLAHRDIPLEVNVDHEDPLRRLPAAIYVPRMTRREVHAGGWVQCPFHKGGKERTPSLKVDGVLWACHACDPLPGKRSFGGNIYDLGGLLAGYALPLRGPDFLDVQGRLARFFGVTTTEAA